ncbi:helix-turn-helix transcriptional regulator [Aliiglaciecola sp. LCG003]|uniref:helix-turn-helix domain-containing protein n=1 Tax=Aliiglaciecola sp. LCG003 TaxID=3053655 RepID=UPI002573A397|nr:helix-turn-helix transcriptional regulator [Aliiglaciecola sp. LCG003]WJG09864.1 helix-turn-helix transcriptional regulator [Aliiglaciecola sp. LCG003]
MEKTTTSTNKKLSKREAQVADKVCQGLTNRSIADQLFISERTVKFHCTNIFKKLTVSNRKMLKTLFPDFYNQAI